MTDPIMTPGTVEYDDWDGVRTKDPGKFTYGDEGQYSMSYGCDVCCPECESPCNMEIESGDGPNPDDDFDARCWSCNVIFEARYEMVPEYQVSAKE